MHNINHATLLQHLQQPQELDIEELTSQSIVIGAIASLTFAIFSESYQNFSIHLIDKAVELADESVKELAASIYIFSLFITTIAVAALTVFGIMFATTVVYPNFCRKRLASEITQKNQNNIPIAIEDITRTIKLCPSRAYLLIDRVNPNILTENEIISFLDVCPNYQDRYNFLKKIHKATFSNDTLIKIGVRDEFNAWVILNLIDFNSLSLKQWREVLQLVEMLDLTPIDLIHVLDDDSLDYEKARLLINPSNFSVLLKKIDSSRLYSQEHIDLLMHAPNLAAVIGYIEKINLASFSVTQIKLILTAIREKGFLQPNSWESTAFILMLCESPKMLCIVQKIFGIQKLKNYTEMGIKTSFLDTKVHVPIISKFIFLPDQCRTPKELRKKINIHFLSTSSTLKEKIWQLAAVHMQFEGKPKMQHAVGQCLLDLLHLGCYPKNSVKVGDEMIAIDLPALEKRSSLIGNSPSPEEEDRKAQVIEFPSIAGIKEYLQFISGISCDTSPENLELILLGADYFGDEELVALLEIYLVREVNSILPQSSDDALLEEDFIPLPPLAGPYHNLEASRIDDPLNFWVPGLFAKAHQQRTSAAASSSSGASSSSSAFSSSSGASST